MSVTRQAHPAQRGEEIPEATRLRLYQLQVEIRYCEKRAYDLFLQNLVKGTSHLALGQEAVAAGFAAARARTTTPSAPIAAITTRLHAALRCSRCWAN